MEVSNTVVSTETNKATPTSLALAITLSLASFLLAFVQTWIHSFGPETLPKIGTALSHPSALSGLIAESLGASFLAPLVHLAIASFFKSKRNPSSRRRIFIGWSLVIIAVGVLSLWTKSKGL